MELFLNFPLWMAIFAIFFAQFIKVPILFALTRKVDWSLIVSTGGMPSSHSAAVTALATGVGLDSGFDSSIFAVATIFAIITMYDATGVRRQAGEHAAILNQLRKDFNRIISEAKDWPYMNEQEMRKELKELLGHKPIEVFFGALTGIFLTLIVYSIIY